MQRIRKAIYLLGFILILLIVLVNPTTLRKFSPDGSIDSIIIMNISWFFVIIFSILLLITLIYPRKTIHYIIKNWKNYVLLFVVILILLSLTEVGLRTYKKDKSGIFKIENFEFNYTLTINTQGFHDSEFKKEKDSNTIRIFIIGDSFVHGIVKDEVTINKLLENKLNQLNTENYEVYNLGISGANPVQYVGIAEKFKDYQPDIVILSLYVDNDIQLNYDRKLRFYEKIILLKEISYPFLNLERNLKCPEWILKSNVTSFYKDLACKQKINFHLLGRATVGDNQEYYDELLSRFKTNLITKDSILKVKQIYKNTPFILLINPSKYQVSTSDFNELKKLGYVLMKIN